MTHSLQRPPLGLLSLAGLLPPLVYVASQQALYPDWRRRLLSFPVLMTPASASPGTTRAVISGFLGERNEFVARRNSPSVAGVAVTRCAPTLSVWMELLMAAYALWGVSTAVKVSPAFVPYLGLYVFAFTWITCEPVDRWQHRIAAQANVTAPL
jgi:hypothetical protein